MAQTEPRVIHRPAPGDDPVVKPQIEGSGVTPVDVEDNRSRRKEKELDHGLKETFPASDPVSINPGAN